MGSSSSGLNERFEVATQAECARFFNLSARTIQIWISEGCPGVSGCYPLAEMLEWAKVNKWYRSSDPMLTSGGESDNLERYRGFRADLAEIDLQDRQSMMINPGKVRETYLASLQFFRAAAERLKQRFGNDAGLLVLEAVENAERQIKDYSTGGSEHETGL